MEVLFVTYVRLLQNLRGRHGGRPSGKLTGLFRRLPEGQAPSCPYEWEVLQEPDALAALVAMNTRVTGVVVEKSAFSLPPLKDIAVFDANLRARNSPPSFQPLFTHLSISAIGSLFRVFSVFGGYPLLKLADVTLRHVVPTQIEGSPDRTNRLRPDYGFTNAPPKSSTVVVAVVVHQTQRTKQTQPNRRSLHPSAPSESQ